MQQAVESTRVPVGGLLSLSEGTSINDWLEEMAGDGGLATGVHFIPFTPTPFPCGRGGAEGEGPVGIVQVLPTRALNYQLKVSTNVSIQETLV